jgi:tetratricopeptide (TPR) repeat protein
MREDRFGNTLTTDSDEAAASYVQALDELFAMYNVARDRVDEALEADPEFALAHCVSARALLLEGETKRAIEVADNAVELAANATERERAHAEIVALVTRGDNADALPRVRAHAAQYPRDPLPLSFALGVYGLLGFGGFVDHHEQQRDLLLSVADEWDEDWWFDGWLGWSYVETGQADLGVPLLDRSLDARPNNATTAHGRAHGYYEMGEIDEGMSFIEKWLPSYDPEEPLHCHIAWHLGLFALQQGDWDKAEDLYLRYVCPSSSQALPMFTLIDSASFLWRSRLYGHPFASAQVDELAEFAKQRFEKPHLPFVNYHRTLVAALGDVELELERDPDGDAREMSAMLSGAVRTFGEGDYAGAVRQLAGVIDRINVIGGSNAQRDLIVDTYIASLVGHGETDRAREVAQARAARRASHLDSKWFALLKAD